MKQSNARDFLFIISLFVFSSAFVWLEFPEMASLPDGDAVDTYHLIQQPPSIWHRIDDWHELLFPYEGRCLYQFLIHLFPNIESHLSSFALFLAQHLGANQHLINKITTQSCTALVVFYIIWTIVTLTLYLTLCLLLRSMKEQKMTLCCFVFFLIVSFFFIRYYNYAVFCKYPDGFFFPLIISAAIGVHFCRMTQGKKRYIWLVFVLLCLFHCIGYRRVAIVTFPVFFYGLLPVFLQIKRMLHRMFTAAAVALIFGLGSHYMLSLLPSYHSHPAIVMMYSDMSMAGLLAGESHQKICEKTGVAGVVCNSKNITPDTIHQWYAVYFIQNRPFVWSDFVQTYLQYIRLHPKEMIVGKAISIIQFYTNFQIPEWVKDYVAYACPNARSGREMWDICTQSRNRYEKLYLYFISLILLLGLLIRHKKLSSISRFFVLLSLAGFAYSLGYWLVTPTPDARFHSFTVMAQCMFISFMAAKCINFCYQYLISGRSISKEPSEK